MVRLNNLPPGAALWRAMGHDAAWPIEAHIAAYQVDVLNLANWQRGGGKGPKPKPYPRPAEAAKAVDPRRQSARVDRLLALQKEQELRAAEEVVTDVEGR